MNTTFRKLLRFVAPAATALGMVAAGPAAAQSPAQAPVAAPLSLQVYNADGASFHVNAVLVSGKTDAVLLDTGFTRADALRIAAMVLDSRKTLKTIYISQADPDVILISSLGIAPMMWRGILGGVLQGSGQFFRFNVATQVPTLLTFIALLFWLVVMDHRDDESALAAWCAAQYVAVLPLPPRSPVRVSALPRAA